MKKRDGRDRGRDGEVEENEIRDSLAWQIKVMVDCNRLLPFSKNVIVREGGGEREGRGQGEDDG